MSRPEILAAIPHRDPFLLVDEIVEQSDSRIVCTKRFSGDEAFFAGHYPGHPLVPRRAALRGGHAVGAILLSHHLADRPGLLPVATRMNDVRFKRMVHPGETLRMEVDLVERLADAFFLKAKITVDGTIGGTVRVCMHWSKEGLGIGIRDWRRSTSRVQGEGLSFDTIPHVPISNP